MSRFDIVPELSGHNPKQNTINMTTIIIKLQMPGIHHWPDAPEKVFYLKFPHRHTFHFELEFMVNHANRDIEFITKRNEVFQFLHNSYWDEKLDLLDFNSMSCEAIAAHLWRTYSNDGCLTVSVGEDGEFIGTFTSKANV